MSDGGQGAEVVPRAIVIGHGGFAAGLISAVDQITGRGALLVGLTNTGMSPAEMEAAVESYVSKGMKVVFTDLPAGSATICARRVCGSGGGVVVVSGVNLPTLLDFVFSAESPADAAMHAAARGRETLGPLRPR